MASDSLMPIIQSSVDTSPDSNRKKRRKTEVDGDNNSNRTSHQNADQIVNRWRTEREQQIYSSKLYDAIRRVQRGSTTSPAADTAKISSNGGREIRATADEVLASSARGTTRWSRAILAKRFRARMRNHKRVKVTGSNRSKKPSARGEKPMKLPGMEKKVRVLSRLVPGCRKLSFSNLLDETSDYIAALEMQVKAMAALTQLLSGSSAAARLDSRQVV